MSRLMQGVTILLFVIVVGAVVTLINASALLSNEAPGCTTTDNATTCENVGRTTFFGFLFALTFEPFPDPAPAWLNILYVSVMSVLLSAGVLLIVLAFVPTTSA